jgi:hypothetical protein
LYFVELENYLRFLHEMMKLDSGRRLSRTSWAIGTREDLRHANVHETRNIDYTSLPRDRNYVVPQQKLTFGYTRD